MKPKILVIGEVCTEFLIRTDELPAAGKTCRTQDYLCLPGGKGAETSVALSKLGAEARLCAKIGDDPNSDELKKYLCEENVDVHYVTRRRGENTALTLRISDNGSDERRIVCCGASSFLSENDVEQALASCPDGVILHGDISDEALQGVVNALNNRSSNVPLFIMSCDKPASFPFDSFGRCDVLALSNDEAYSYTGINPCDQEGCMRACLVLRQKIKAGYIVLRLDNRGFFLYDGLYYDFIPAYDVEVPNGAVNDCSFAASFVREYIRSGGNAKKACAYASVACASFMKRGGNIASYPTNEDIKKYIKKNNIEISVDDD